MMGKSWGGFNALQVAALRPPALRAIITVCSTDDRYADDIHYMGGALLNDNLWWATIMLGYQSRRPSLYDLTAEMQRMRVPTLIMAGDEEEPCLEACLLMKRCIPSAGLAVLPRSGHAINLEEPALFNALVEDFLHQVEAGRWDVRDPRSVVPSIWGPGGKP